MNATSSLPFSSSTPCRVTAVTSARHSSYTHPRHSPWHTRGSSILRACSLQNLCVALDNNTSQSQSCTLEEDCGAPKFLTTTSDLRELVESFECSAWHSNRRHPENPRTIGAVSSSHSRRYTGQCEHCAIDRPCHSLRQYTHCGPMQGHTPILVPLMGQCLVHEATGLERDLIACKAHGVLLYSFQSFKNIDSTKLEHAMQDFVFFTEDSRNILSSYFKSDLLDLLAKKVCKVP